MDIIQALLQSVKFCELETRERACFAKEREKVLTKLSTKLAIGWRGISRVHSNLPLWRSFPPTSVCSWDQRRVLQLWIFGYLCLGVQFSVQGQGKMRNGMRWGSEWNLRALPEGTRTRDLHWSSESLRTFVCFFICEIAVLNRFVEPLSKGRLYTTSIFQILHK